MEYKPMGMNRNVRASRVWKGAVFVNCRYHDVPVILDCKKLLVQGVFFI